MANEFTLHSSKDATSAGELARETVCLFDIVREDSDDLEPRTDSKLKSRSHSQDTGRSKSCSSGSGEERGHQPEVAERMEGATSIEGEPKEAAIMCNSTEMIREKCSTVNGESL